MSVTSIAPRVAGLATTVPADVWPYHHNLGPGGWIPMMLGMVIFWGAIIAAVVWLVRGGLTARSETPQDILRRRLAEGSISVEEYEQRRAALDPEPEPGGALTTSQRTPRPGAGGTG